MTQRISMKREAVCARKTASSPLPLSSRGGEGTTPHGSGTINMALLTELLLRQRQDGIGRRFWLFFLAGTKNYLHVNEFDQKGVGHQYIGDPCVGASDQSG